MNVGSRVSLPSLETKAQIYQSLDSEGKIREVSRGWLEKLGYHKDEVIGHPFFDFIDPTYQEKIKHKFGSLKKNGRVDNVEIKLLSKEGHVIEVSLNGEVVYDERGAFKHTMCEIKTLHYYVNSYAETLKLLQKETFHRTISDVAWRVATINTDDPFGYIQEALTIIRSPLEVYDIRLSEDINSFIDGHIIEEMEESVYFVSLASISKNLKTDEYNHYAVLKVEGLSSYVHMYLNFSPFMDTWWNQALKILQKSIEVGYQRIFELKRRLIIERHLEFSNENLRQRIEEEIQKRAIKEQSLLQQSKMAAMGEMISNIAHQWRQPINSLGIIVQNLALLHQHKMLDDASMGQMQRDMLQLISMMSETIDSFRNFFKPATKTEEFTLGTSIKETLHLLEAATYNANIIVNYLPYEEELYVMGYKNELSQVVLNILTNAKDALVANKIKNPTIVIETIKEDHKGKIIICDNAGGISSLVFDQIFDPFFTTKDAEGTGIGLYMSRIIIEEKFKGTIRAYNQENGACFEIVVPLM